MEEINETVSEEASQNKELWDAFNNLFTERELKEIDFAVMYAEHFDHGTDGHNRLKLISKLYFLLAKSYLKGS